MSSILLEGNSPGLLGLDSSTPQLTNELSPGKIEDEGNGTDVSKSGYLEESPLEMQQSSEPISHPAVSSIPVKQPINTGDESSASVPEKSSVSNPYVKSKVMTNDAERMDEIIENFNSEGNDPKVNGNTEKNEDPESGNCIPNQTLKTAEESKKAPIEDSQEPQESASNLHVNSEMIGEPDVTKEKSEVAKPMSDPERSMASTSVEKEGASKEALSGEPIVMTLGSSAVEVADPEDGESENLTKTDAAEEGVPKETEPADEQEVPQNKESEAPEVSIEDEDESSGKSADFVKTPQGAKKEDNVESEVASAKSVEHFEAGSKSDPIVATAASLEHESEPVKEESALEKGEKSAQEAEPIPEDDDGEADVDASKNIVETPNVTREAFEAENANADTFEARSKNVVETPNVTQEMTEGVRVKEPAAEESVKNVDSRKGSDQEDANGGSDGQRIEGREDEEPRDEENEEQAKSTSMAVPPVHVVSHGTLSYNGTEEKQSEVVTSEPSYTTDDLTLPKSGSDVVGTPAGLTDIPEASKEPGTSEEKNSDESGEDDGQVKEKETQEVPDGEQEPQKENEEIKRNSNETEEYKYEAGWIGGSVPADAEAGAVPAQQPDVANREETEEAENEKPTTVEDKCDEIDSREQQDLATAGRSRRGSIGSVKRHRSRGARNSITVNPPLQIYSNRTADDNVETEKNETEDEQGLKSGEEQREMQEGQKLPAPGKASEVNEITVNNEVDLTDEKNAENEAGDVSDSVVQSMPVNVATGKEDTIRAETTLEPESPEWGRGDMETDIESLNQKLKTEDVKPPTTSGCCVVL